MSTLLTRIWTLWILLALSSCAVDVKSKKLDSAARPIEKIEVSVWMGDISAIKVATPKEKMFYNDQLRKAMNVRLPEIFRANGVTLDAMSIQQTPILLPQIQESIRKTKVSHILVINAQTASYTARYGVTRSSILGVDFEADLWDVASQKVVWKANPSLPIVEAQPLLKSQQFAGKLLNGLHRDGFVKLAHGHAVDLEGREITDYLGSTPDR